MLKLKRKRYETIIIDPDGINAVVTVAYIGRNMVEIGVDAPREVLILRGEIMGPGAESIIRS